MKKVIYTIYYLPTVPKVGMTRRWPDRLKENVQAYHRRGIQIDPKTARVLTTTTNKQYGEALEDYYKEWYNCKEPKNTSYSDTEHKNKLARSPESRKKNSLAKLGNKSRYNTGNRYREVSTGFEGTWIDHKKKFKLTGNSYLSPEKLGYTFTKGKYKGMCWILIDSSIGRNIDQ